MQKVKNTDICVEEDLQLGLKQDEGEKFCLITIAAELGFIKGLSSKRSLIEANFFELRNL